MRNRRLLPAVLAILVAAGLWWFDIRQASWRPPTVSTPNSGTGTPTAGQTALQEQAVAPQSEGNGSETSVDQISIDELLRDAKGTLEAMSRQLNDYTATFVKQERDDDGTLGPEGRIAMKVQTRFRSPDANAPKRVYLKFQTPDNLAGREVIWGRDLYDRQMAVHETGFLLNLKTLWLNPTGMIAMQGQRYPISEIGMVRLAEKLIERGEALREQNGVVVLVNPNAKFDDQIVTEYRIVRPAADGSEDDFSAAEICIDPTRSLILRYRSFGWPQTGQDAPPMLESYAYVDVQTNVGLSDSDFDVTNESYSFP